MSPLRWDFLFCGWFLVAYQEINKEHTHIEEGEGTLVLCKTPRVSVFGPHTRESLAEAKWTKVNKSGHYVWAPVNSCSLVSLCFKKRGGRCDHEESPCLFFSSHYREGLGSPPLPPPSSSSLPLFSPLSPFQLSLSASCFSLSLSSSLLSSLLLFVLLPSLSRFARPVFLKHAGRERSMVSSERGNYTAEFR